MYVLCMHTFFNYLIKIFILEASDSRCSNQTIQALSASANITQYCGSDTTTNCDTSVIQKQEKVGNQKKRRRSTESLTEFISSDINVDSDLQHENSYEINSFTRENYIVESEKEKETAEDRDMFAESDEERDSVDDTEQEGGKENDSLLCPVCFQAR